MATIITTSQVQQKIGEIAANIGKKHYIVTNRGLGRMVILPYFDGCQDLINEYIEDYEMQLNKDKLEAELKASLKSGPSDLVI